MKRQFNILACRDISKSEFSEAERQRAAQAQPGRTLLLDQDDNSNSTSNYFNTTQKRCLKLVLQPLSQSDLPELLTAFEFAGSLPVAASASSDVLEGKILEIDSDRLDLARGILLLHSSQCKILDDSIPDAFFEEDNDFQL